MGPSCPVEETMTLLSSTLGSMHIWVSWLRETRVQLVTAPPTYGPLAGSSRMTRSSTAVALNSLMFGACCTKKKVIAQACCVYEAQVGNDIFCQ